MRSILRTGWLVPRRLRHRPPDQRNQILSTAPRNVLPGRGLVDENLNVTRTASVTVCSRSVPTTRGECGYYQFLQGTSMASPHATGVAALAVSAHGHTDSRQEAGTTSPDA